MLAGAKRSNPPKTKKDSRYKRGVTKTDKPFSIAVTNSADE